jgi:Na+/H+ antiporter NhaC
MAAILFPGRVAPAWYSLIPPLLAVILALITHRVLLSLGLAVLVGGLLQHVPAAPTNPMAWANGLRQAGVFLGNSIARWNDQQELAIEWDNVKIMAFVMAMMATIMVTVVSGGLQAIVQRFARLARGVRSTQTATALAGLVIFVDDYANSMLVGHSMRPLTDRYRISREKLAFLVDSTSAPIAGLALVSTWIGFEVALFQQQADALQLGYDGYTLFLYAWPFRFYCLFVVVFIFANALSGKDFGPMATAERRARRGDPSGASEASTAPAEPDDSARLYAASGVIPLLGLLLALVTALWLDVFGFHRLWEQPAVFVSLTSWREVLLAKKDLGRALASAGGVSFILALICGMVLARVPARRLIRAAIRGAQASLLPAVILLLAWSLKNVCDTLQTGDFLGAAVGDSVPALWFPAVVFVVAGATAFATGTSWTTMLILIPVATPMAFRLDGCTYGLVTAITLAAVLDGAIFGDHCSPISDTTILSSAASGCDHIQHVRTQAPYAVLVAILALVCGYIPAAWGVPAGWLLLGGTAGIVCLFLWLKPWDHPLPTIENRQLSPDNCRSGSPPQIPTNQD